MYTIMYNCFIRYNNILCTYICTYSYWNKNLVDLLSLNFPWYLRRIDRVHLYAFKKKNFFVLLLFVNIVNFCANCHVRAPVSSYDGMCAYVLIRKGLRVVIRPDSYRISLVRTYNYLYIYS